MYTNTAEGALGPEAEKDLYNKRWVHIGNDDVHIVWSDHDQEYSTDHIQTKVCVCVFCV
jgi:hypothetical protein